MTGGNGQGEVGRDGDAGQPAGDEEARLAAVLALLALARGRSGPAPTPHAPLAHWRATRMNALRGARD